MKTYLLPLVIGMALTARINAAVILDESFTYSDGPLTNVSGNTWSNFSGTLGQVNVAAGKVVISQDESEDVSRLLAGAPYHDSDTLYASFLVNCSTLPLAGAGTYFVNFKDGGTVNLKCRVFATTSGAAAGMFRVGIANGGSTFVSIPRDLSLGTDYLLVIRYNTGGGPNASTLWINPASEAATTDRAVSVDNQSATDVTTFVLRQSNANGGMGILTLDNLKVGTAFSDVVAGGSTNLNPPFMSSIANQTVARNGVPAPSPFYVTDGETPNGSLTLSFASSNPTLVPVGNITFTSDGDSNRTVTATPAAGQQGVSQITVTVTDGDTNTASRDFLLIVGAPTISTFTNLDILKDTSTPAISFTVGDLEGDALTVSARSSNETVVPISGIAFSGSGPNRNVTITPASGLAGLSRVSIVVSDGFNTASNSFVLTVYPNTGPIFSDTFSYPDGSLTTNSSFVWNNHSGIAGQVKVLGGKVYISGTNSEDVSAFLGVSSFLPSGGWILYVSYTVNFGIRPPGAGDYFAHFRNGNSFGCKVFSTTNGAAPGKFRLGLSSAANAPSATWPGDLDANVTYTVVTRMNVGTGACKLWVDPASEGSTSVASTDAAFPFEVLNYAFRENSGIGDIVIDDFKSGTAFANVLAASYSLAITVSDANVQISWPVAAVGYHLQLTGDPAGPWTDSSDPVTVEGDQKVVRYLNTTGLKFFRLKNP